MDLTQKAKEMFQIVYRQKQGLLKARTIVFAHKQNHHVLHRQYVVGVCHRKVCTSHSTLLLKGLQLQLCPVYVTGARQLAAKSVEQAKLLNGQITHEDDNGNPTSQNSSIHDATHTNEKESFSMLPVVGSDFTVFYKPSQNVITVPLNSKHQESQVSIHFRSSDRLVNLSRRRPDGSPVEDTVIEEKMLDDPSVRSIDELMWKPMETDRSKLPAAYLKLAKSRLTALVVVTGMAGYAMAPGVFDPLTFLACTVGTGLTSAAANTINQFFEVPYDSQMNRTKNRPIVRGVVSPLHAVTFAGVTGASGISLLLLGTNPMTAVLGAFNLGLYTLVYTPMKRLSIANTWVGSVVGAIPPLMGWAACSGQLDPGAWLMGAVLFAWQFPHFNALSWNLRPDYSRAGYRMMSVMNPALCKRVTLRYSIGMIGICTLAPVLDITTWTFAADSLPFNLYLAYLAWRFYQNGDSKSSRTLFRFSLIHVPAILVLMLISKKKFGEGGKSKPSGMIVPLQ